MRPKPAYAYVPSGEVHYWSLGEGPPLVLLHWAPASGRMYARAMPVFAAAGHWVIAPDLPGFGRSHHNHAAAAIPDLADDVLAALDAVGVAEFALLGGHLSASVAVAMARRAPSRVRALVLDGLLNLEPAEFAALVAGFAGHSPRPDPAGKYKAFPVEMTLATLHEWNPDFHIDDETIADVYALMADYLQMGYGPIRGYLEPGTRPAPAPYPLRGELPELRVPTLLLTAEREALRPAYSRSLAAIPGARGHEFAGVHPLMAKREAEYVAVVDGFLRSARRGA
jgi:pimeloyl-ACP methyl ester carboxylesterase